jgi:iron complex transport system permease protein
VLVADRFTVAGLGKDVATNVGLSYERVVLLGVGLVSLTTGVVTVVIGMLPFLGLIVPNLVSMIRGDDLRTNLPWVFLAGIWLVTVCDIIGRVLIMPYEVPVSLVLGVVGAAVFIFLLLRTRRTGVR